MKDIKLAGKKVLFDKSPVLFSYNPAEDWEKFFDVKSGIWYYDNGAIIGEENTNKGGILFTKESFDICRVSRYMIKYRRLFFR